MGRRPARPRLASVAVRLTTGRDVRDGISRSVARRVVAGRVLGLERPERAKVGASIGEFAPEG